MTGEQAFARLMKRVREEAQRLALADFESSYQKLLEAGIQPTEARLRDMGDALLQQHLASLEQEIKRYLLQEMIKDDTTTDARDLS